MTSTRHPRSNNTPHRLALVLQGGGALGAYQCGVYEELASAGMAPHWVVGVSIGAINAALIVGNPPERRLERLREFWSLVSSGVSLPAPTEAWARGWFNQLSAGFAALVGVPGFYQPRVPPAVLAGKGTPQALSLYDTASLRKTLERLVDFDLINSRRLRLAVGAVNVLNGNSVYFDNQLQTLGPEHIMASGALPPAFGPVMIDGQPYWDGGIVSNTPLQYLLDTRGQEALRVFQVDLFSARGEMPTDLASVAQRQKDILYSSRTRYGTDKIAEIEDARLATLELIGKLPPALRDDPAAKLLAERCRSAPLDIVHLIYRKRAYEAESKDYEFSRASVTEHWAAGREDMRYTHEHPEWLASSKLENGVSVYDIARDRIR